FSSAAFFIVAACLVPGSELRLRNIGMDPRRTGLLRVLELMGADIKVEPSHKVEPSRARLPADDSSRAWLGSTPTADIVVRHAPLHGIQVPVDCVPDMIDEFPALCV